LFSFPGVSSLISLDSDDESDDDTMHREPLIDLSSNIENSDPVGALGSTVCTGKVDNGRGTATCTRMTVSHIYESNCSLGETHCCIF
jgi:crossover junction endonuclease EME1